MSFYRIAILRGGPGDESDVSMSTGKNFITALQPRHKIIDVVIDKDEKWYVDGKQKDPSDIAKHSDIFLNALHGTYGEDGKVQQILDHLQTPYTGTGALASALGMHKWKAKEIFKSVGLKTPRAKLVSDINNINDQALEIFKTFTLPVIIKPVSSGSSIGVSVGRDLKSIEDALISVFQYTDTAIIEEYIKGKEATCVVAENFRGQKYYAFPPIEIVKHSDVTFDNKMKYEGFVEEKCPGNFTQTEKDAIMQAAINAHIGIGARHYSRSDFIVHPTRGIYILEINTLPGFTENSLVPKALEAVGSNTKEFLEHIISLVLEK